MNTEIRTSGMVVKKDVYADIVASTDWRDFEPIEKFETDGVTVTRYSNKTKDNCYWLIDSGSDDVIVTYL